MSFGETKGFCPFRIRFISSDDWCVLLIIYTCVLFSSALCTDDALSLPTPIASLINLFIVIHSRDF